MSKSALRRRAKEARHWLFDACFPLWSERGLNESGLFVDALSLDHTPLAGDKVLVSTQARQTSVFAQAGRLGWKPDTARDLVEDGVRTLSGLARRDDGLIGRTLLADASALSDQTPYLGDLAASLHALALSSEMLEDGSGVIASVRALLDSLDRRMKDRTNGGYAEMLPMMATRQQAPHMRLLEACLHPASRRPGRRSSGPGIRSGHPVPREIHRRTWRPARRGIRAGLECARRRRGPVGCAVSPIPMGLVAGRICERAI